MTRAALLRQFALARNEVAHIKRVFGPDAVKVATLTFPRPETKPVKGQP